MDLTDDEVRATKKLLSLNTKEITYNTESVIVLNTKDIEAKIKELEIWAENKKFKESDVPQYEYIRGKIDCLKAVLENNIYTI